MTARGPSVDQALTPWERGRNEPPATFALFVLYRDMGLERTLAKLGDAAGKKRGALKALSSRWKWTDRCLEFDRWADRATQQALVRRRVEAQERHARIGRMMQGKGIEVLQALDTKKATASGGARLLEAGVKTERLALGESTENVESKVAFEGLGDALRALCDEAEQEKK